MVHELSIILSLTLKVGKFYFTVKCSDYLNGGKHYIRCYQSLPTDAIVQRNCRYAWAIDIF